MHVLLRFIQQIHMVRSSPISCLSIKIHNFPLYLIGAILRNIISCTAGFGIYYIV
jgi:hypothetical protein